MESLSTTFSKDDGILVTIDCKIVDVTVETTLVGRNNVSVTVSTVVDVNVWVSSNVRVVGGEPNTDVSVLVTVDVWNRVTCMIKDCNND